MKILIALPIQHRPFDSIDRVLEGQAPCSGTDGSFIRLANLLHDAGLDVWLSVASSDTSCTRFPCIHHSLVDAEQFDTVVAHQSHWNGSSFTFGERAVAKTVLWLHNHLSPAAVHTFLLEGGRQIVCPSFYHASIYRAIPRWAEKISVIYNSYSPVFTPSAEPPRPQLLFIGAVARSKGFVELTKMWSYLAEKNVSLELAIAGSRSIHAISSGTEMGAMGLAELELETNCIEPWLKELPEEYHPKFLGPLSPIQLRDEIAQSWAVIVNPSAKVPETFCVAAVEAQACGRTVFSLDCGALRETVYRHQFNSLAEKRSPEALGDRILDGLANQDAVAENGRHASGFIRNTFSLDAVREAWLALLTGSGSVLAPYLPHGWSGPKDVLLDLMRWSGTGILINQYRNAEYRQVLQAYYSARK